MDCTGTIVDVGCDGTAGSDEDECGKSLLLLDLRFLLLVHGGLFVDGDLGVLVDPDTDVVSALHLQDDDVGCTEFVVRHYLSNVCLTACLEGDHASLGSPCGLEKSLSLVGVTHSAHGIIRHHLIRHSHARAQP